MVFSQVSVGCDGHFTGGIDGAEALPPSVALQVFCSAALPSLRARAACEDGWSGVDCGEKVCPGAVTNHLGEATSASRWRFQFAQAELETAAARSCMAASYLEREIPGARVLQVEHEGREHGDEEDGGAD